MQAKKTILLVEDDSIISLEESMLLERSGYRVVSASNGEEAVEIFSDDVAIDLILMDINLGEGMDGFEAAGMILAENDVPLVFLSSHTAADVIEKTEKITSYGYITKNSGESVMLASIKMAFRLYEANQENMQTSKLFDATFNSINDAIMLLDLDYHVQKCNTAMRKFLGKPDEEIIGQKCMELVHYDRRTPEDCPCRKMKKSGLRERMELPVNGKFYEVIVDPLFDENGRLKNAIHIITDISGRKTSEVQLKLKLSALMSPDIVMDEISFTDIFDLAELQKLQDDFGRATGIASLVTETDGTPITKIIGAKRFCEKVIRGTNEGYERCLASDNLMNSTLTDEVVWTKCSSAGLWEAISKISVGGKHVANWCIGQVRDKSMSTESIARYAEEIGADPQEAVAAFLELPLMDVKQLEDITILVNTMTDIISKILYQNMLQARMLIKTQQAEAEIKILLEEKEFLLTEVHHRMKNNMASVEALLELQQPEMPDNAAKEALKSVSLQVASVRILYDKLLRADRYSNLPLNSFVSDIIESVKNAYRNNAEIEFYTEIDDIRFDSNKLFELGLIINELVTNIYKYAFVGMESGHVTMKVSKTDTVCELLLQDDGCGLPEGFNTDKGSSFGIKLVKMFAAQMNGDFTIENVRHPGSGTVCRLKLALDL
ncbi:MAG: PocR ligand-binding domain-containing protein [Spirochaetales bacterium]|uniref:histidine kinase n=1 Tax=Candidatus Thalassospirochaeta sargassi TaxID=3119039 RepID=A0AAJ1IHD0_9SPIO|nr:PocR ligand-binding domain-containing protein [Spirochaetales bacterium]